MNFREGKSRRIEATLDLTPLIDVVFLLLIFFLVTATFAQRDMSVVPVDLPEGSTGDAATATARITVYVEANGTFTLDSLEGDTVENLSLGEIEDLLEALYAANPDAPLYLRGDRDVRYGEVMLLLDSARRIGFRRVFNVIYQRP